MGWLLVLFYYRSRRRLRQLDHAHDAPTGDRIPLAGEVSPKWSPR